MLFAIEKNLMIANDIKTKVLSPGGLSLLTPFVYTSKISLNAARRVFLKTLKGIVKFT